MRIIDADEAEKLLSEFDWQEMYLPVHFQENVLDECETLLGSTKDMDEVLKVNLWLIHKYGADLRKDFGLKQYDFSREGYEKVMKMFEYIYEEQQKETPEPFPWSNYENEKQK